MKNFIQQWHDLDLKFKITFIALIVVGAILIFFQSMYREEIAHKLVAAEEQKHPAASTQFQALPNTNRNQGLEDLTAQISKLNDEVNRWRIENQSNANKSQLSLPLGVEAPIDLNKTLPPLGGEPGGVAFDAFADDKTSASATGASTQAKEVSFLKNDLPSESHPLAHIKVWQTDKNRETEAHIKEPKLIIPVNSALEAVMLSGINARPPGSISGAVGSVNSANDV
ncbi:MAG: hypothetical protein IT497_03570 [Ottowia sp.]|nr:hypothetical protein [Ottowia sp.]